MGYIDDHHIIWKLYFEQLYLAPVLPTIREVLDVGCGTGTWAREFASAHPSVHVLGIDISPPENKLNDAGQPSNCDFRQGNAEQDWFGMPPSKQYAIDYIYSRMLATAIRDWPALCSQVHKHLQPGGFYESIDTVIELNADDMTAAADRPAIRWFARLRHFIAGNGVDTNAMDEQGQYLRDAGFDIVEERSFPFYLDSTRPEMKGKEWISEMAFQATVDFMSPMTPKIFADIRDDPKASNVSRGKPRRI